jgi:hypothetical protein
LGLRCWKGRVEVLGRGFSGAPASPTFACDAVAFVTARDAKFFAGELAMTAGVQNGLDVTAQVRPHADAVVKQGAHQRFGQGPAEQQIQMEFRQGLGQGFRRLRRQDEFPPAGFLTRATR